MLLTHRRLVQLVNDGVIRGGSVDHVNAASVDVHLASTFLVEGNGGYTDRVVDVSLRESLMFHSVTVGEGFHYHMRPHQFVLASTRETFHLPANISALFVMKSSVARCGLDQMNAAWCSPGWSGSALTLELSNLTQFHTLMLAPGMAIGQMVFFEGESVEDSHLYLKRGSFNHQPKVAPSS